MKVIRAHNVDEGLHQLFRKLYTQGNAVTKSSRNGPVLKFNEATTITWEHPMHRVSFDAVRDANPFFHLFEAFWMLNGDNDAKRPAYFAAGLAQYSDDGETMAGAYGHRWRKHFGYDQIDEYIIPNLRKNKEDRRCVLQMWDPVFDVENGRKDGKDLCCNLSVEFDASSGRLDMMVTNRSNDAVLGATGANIVHFAFLQEYIAGALGIQVGRYDQVSMNMHAYIEAPVTQRCIKAFKIDVLNPDRRSAIYNGRVYHMYDRNIDPDLMKIVLDKDIAHLLDNYNKDEFKFESNFFKIVVGPMIRSFNLYKQDKLERAIQELDKASTSDWAIAGLNWLDRRCTGRNRKIKSLAQEGTGVVAIDDFHSAVKFVWPSAVERTVTSDIGPLVTYEAEVWNGSRAALETVATWREGMVTIRPRGPIDVSKINTEATAA
jgi:thymidylate synthase